MTVKTVNDLTAKEVASLGDIKTLVTLKKDWKTLKDTGRDPGHAAPVSYIHGVFHEAATTIKEHNICIATLQDKLGKLIPEDTEIIDEVCTSLKNILKQHYNYTAPEKHLN